jgi:DNA-binding transcriptional ArsR family regulator
MSKTGKTKKEILELLSKKNYTLTEISDLLGLAPSTVKQHIEELEGAGAVSISPNPYVKKWKYYRVNPEFDLDTYRSDRVRFGRGIIPYAVGAMVVLVVAYLAYSGLAYNNAVGVGTGAKGNQLAVMLMDPPQVPAGTNALTIFYSSMQVHESGVSGSGWIAANGSGELNLMTLLNVSQIIAKANVSNNATVNMVRFNITNASISINGTGYPVVVPSGDITAHIIGAERVNGTSSLLVDFAPTIATIYTANSTIFVMVPSVKAVVVGNGRASANSVIGSREQLREGEMAKLNGSANISLSNGTIKQLNSSTSISVVVRNNGNQTVRLSHLMLAGPITSQVTINANESERIESHGSVHGGVNITIDEIGPNGATVPDVYSFDGIAAGAGMDGSVGEGHSIVANLTAKGNGTIGIGTALALNETENAQRHIGSALNASIGEGAEAQAHGGANESGGAGGGEVGIAARMNATGRYNTTARSLEDVGIDMVRYEELNFIVGQNGTLVLPAAEHDFVAGGGYELKPGASVTLVFNGSMSFGDSRITAHLVPGDTYTLRLLTEDTYSALNVTAG